MKKKPETKALFVLDASVAIRWVLQDGSSSDTQYADDVLGAFKTSQAVVPYLWYSEISHVLGNAIKRGLATLDHSISALARINSLPIYADDVSARYLQTNLLKLMQDLNISGYDSQYLELAIRLDVPLATLDLDLRKAAKKMGIAVFHLESKAKK